ERGFPRRCRWGNHRSPTHPSGYPPGVREDRQALVRACPGHRVHGRVRGAAMYTTTGSLAYRSDPVPAWQRPDPALPVAAAADPGLSARRDLGNDFLQRSADCDEPARTDTGGCPGGCGGCALSRMVQPKLTVGAAGGPDEQEADRVADRVVGMPGGAS